MVPATITTDDRRATRLRDEGLTVRACLDVVRNVQACVDRATAVAVRPLQAAAGHGVDVAVRAHATDPVVELVCNENAAIGSNSYPGGIGEVRLEGRPA